MNQISKKSLKFINLYAVSLVAVATVGVFSSTDIIKAEEVSSSRGNVKVCHSTGSVTNPYVRIDIAPEGAYHGHFANHNDDVIQPFEYEGVTYSKNENGVNGIHLDDNCQPFNFGD